MNILEGSISENELVEIMQRYIPLYLSHLVDNYSEHHQDEHVGVTIIHDLCELCYLPKLMNDSTKTQEEKFYCLSLAIQAHCKRINAWYEIVQ